MGPNRFVVIITVIALYSKTHLYSLLSKIHPSFLIVSSPSQRRTLDNQNTCRCGKSIVHCVGININATEVKSCGLPYNYNRELVITIKCQSIYKTCTHSVP